jgi:hypothetical protein
VGGVRNAPLLKKGIDILSAAYQFWVAASGSFLEADKVFERSEFLSAGRKFPDMLIKA